MNNIEITSETISLDEIKTVLESQPEWKASGISLDIKRPISKYRSSIDPTILIAIVSVVGTSLGTLVSGLLQIAKQKGEGKDSVSNKEWCKIGSSSEHTP
ncbi:hypothetical protein KJ682_18710 [bacterium]|nr:hypothetical protein [bacterium]